MFKIFYWIVYCILKPIYRLKFLGRENVPQGACVVCGNHTNIIDSILVVMALGPSGDFAVIAKAELFKNKLVGAFLRSIHAFPVQRGKSDLSAVKTSFKTLKEGKKLIIFPEGTRVKEGESVDAKAGAAMFSIRGNAPVLPVYITPNKHVFKKSTLTFGLPFTAQIEGKPSTEDYREFSEKIMSEIKLLGATRELTE